MLGIFTSKKLKALEEVLTCSHRGIHKRIDENRELLETLQRHAPELLEKHWWVEGWLQSQDGFLSDVLAALPVANPVPSQYFPRPWPTALEKNVEAAPRTLTSHRPSEHPDRQ